MDWKRILVGRWTWWRLLVSLGSIYLLVAIFALLFADKMIFHPPIRTYDRDLDHLGILETERAEEIAYLYYKARAGKPTFIYSHGNAEDIGQSVSIFEQLNRLGFGVIAYDYPGYGLSSGKPTAKAINDTITRIYRFALSQNIESKDIILIGRSVGSGPSVDLAAKEDLGGLILIAPFKSTFSVAIPTPFPVLLGDRFKNLKQMPKVEEPLLIFHGELDQVIPIEHGRALLAASPADMKSMIEIPEANHNDIFSLAEYQIYSEIKKFIARLRLEE